MWKAVTDPAALHGEDGDVIRRTRKSITLENALGRSGHRQQTAGCAALRVDYGGLGDGERSDASHYMLIFIAQCFLGNTGKAKKGKNIKCLKTPVTIQCV